MWFLCGQEALVLCMVVWWASSSVGRQIIILLGEFPEIANQDIESFEFPYRDEFLGFSSIGVGDRQFFYDPLRLMARCIEDFLRERFMDVAQLGGDKVQGEPRVRHGLLLFLAWRI